MKIQTIVNRLYKKLDLIDIVDVYDKGLTWDEILFVTGRRGTELEEARSILAKGHREEVEKSTLSKVTSILLYPIFLVGALVMPLIGLLFVVGMIGTLIFLILALTGVIQF